MGRRASDPIARLRGVVVRIPAAIAGYRWSRQALAAYRAEIRTEGLDVRVAPPPTVSRGSLRGTLVALRRDQASCLERSLVVQRWYASAGVALDVIIGVRRPDAAAAAAAAGTGDDGATAHAWVDHWDRDFSGTYAEIRRVSAPEGVPPRHTGR